MNKGLFVFLNLAVVLVLLTFSSLVLYFVFQKIYQHILATRVEELVRQSVNVHYSRIE